MKLVGRNRLADILPNTSVKVSEESNGIENMRCQGSFARGRQAGGGSPDCAPVQFIFELNSFERRRADVGACS